MFDVWKFTKTIAVSLTTYTDEFFVDVNLRFVDECHLHVSVLFGFPRSYGHSLDRIVAQRLVLALQSGLKKQRVSDRTVCVGTRLTENEYKYYYQGSIRTFLKDSFDIFFFFLLLNDLATPRRSCGRHLGSTYGDVRRRADKKHNRGLRKAAIPKRKYFKPNK